MENKNIEGLPELTPSGQILTLNPIVFYEIDFEKVKTVEDVVRILKVMNITFSEWMSQIDDVKDLLKEK
jgi:hypothetical protein